MSNEKPILFSGPMVRAILEGRKTQTRRVVKIQPNGICRITQSGEFEDLQIGGSGKIKCPYPVGTRLWVRETWQACPVTYDYYNGGYEADYPYSEIPKEKPSNAWVTYKTDGDNEGPWRPSIHMPRWASRITLEVTEVRVQRLREINAGDCYAEGCDHKRIDDFTDGPDMAGAAWGAIDWYKDLWNSINGPGAWDANPWVWAYTFKVVDHAD